jgi:beta-lactamase superfamily II metal-dependent hydrolase
MSRKVSLTLIILISLAFQAYAGGPFPGRLPAWEEGMLDIHCISTGCGNCSYLVLPDGTTMLIDAGDLRRPDSRAPSPKPDSTRSPGEWIVDYIRSFMPEGRTAGLDYALVTHFHDDHMGSAANARELAKEGAYPLSGITEVGTLLPIRTFIDRGKDYPEPVERYLDFYNRFIDWQCNRGMVYEKARVGSRDQIVLVHEPDSYPNFSIRILFANGEIAHPRKEKVAKSLYKGKDYPGENNLSVGFRLDYGPFSYYTGGDISGIGHTGKPDPKSMESQVARLIGPVDVAVLNHHGNRDTQNEDFVATLRPRVWLGLSWGIRHPGEEVIRRISSRYVYPGDRDIYTTYMAPETQKFMGRYTNDYKSFSGHIVIRVHPRGEDYEIYVLDDASPEKNIITHTCYRSNRKDQ